MNVCICQPDLGQCLEVMQCELSVVVRLLLMRRDRINLGAGFSAVTLTVLGLGILPDGEFDM